MIKYFQFTMAALLLSVAAPSAFAQNERGSSAGFVGLSAGYADPTNLKGRLGFGADVGTMLWNGLMTSAYYRYSSASEMSTDVKVEHYGLGADMSLAPYVPNWMGGLHGGLRAGVSTLDPVAKSDGGSKKAMEFSYGPAVGYDLFQLGYGLSVGAEAMLLFTGGGNKTNTLYVTANLRYWF